MKAGISNEQYLEKSMDVFSILLATRQSGNHIHAEEIKERTGVETRTIADMIRCFQRQGYPIISGDGYKWAKCRFEFLRHLVKERRRALSIMDSVSKAKKKSLNNLTPDLWDQEKKVA